MVRLLWKSVWWFLKKANRIFIWPIDSTSACEPRRVGSRHSDTCSGQFSCSVVSYSATSMLGLPVHNQFQEFTENHVHWDGDAIQPSHPLSSPSPSALSLSQRWGAFQMSQFFTAGGQSIGVSASISVLPMSIQDWFPLGWTGWISLWSKGLSKVFSNTTGQKHQFFGAQLSHPYMTTYGLDHSLD